MASQEAEQHNGHDELWRAGVWQPGVFDAFFCVREGISWRDHSCGAGQSAVLLGLLCNDFRPAIRLGMAARRFHPLRRLWCDACGHGVVGYRMLLLPPNPDWDSWVSANCICNGCRWRGWCSALFEADLVDPLVRRYGIRVCTLEDLEVFENMFIQLYRKS